MSLILNCGPQGAGGPTLWGARYQKINQVTHSRNSGPGHGRGQPAFKKIKFLILSRGLQRRRSPVDGAGR